MKSLPDLQRDMSTLYEELRAGKLDLKLASELANIAGKNLKAKQLELAEKIFLSGRGDPAPHVIGEDEPARPPFPSVPTFPSATQLLTGKSVSAKKSATVDETA